MRYTIAAKAKAAPPMEKMRYVQAALTAFCVMVWMTSGTVMSVSSS